MPTFEGACRLAKLVVFGCLPAEPAVRHGFEYVQFGWHASG